MEQKFAAAWNASREKAADLGVRMRPVEPGKELAHAQRCLSGHRVSDGFDALVQKRRLDLSLEALAVKKAFTGLFSDEQANNALMRLLEAGYQFK